jgi:cytochrome c-type biogenesis protein
MQIGNVTVWLAFIAGVASFLSPCVLALVPAYIGYLGGRAAGGEGGANSRFTTFTHGLAFVFGFSAVFITFNIIGFGLGRALYNYQLWLGRIGGFIIIVFGLHMIGVFRIPLFEYDTRVQNMPDPKWGYLSSVLMGVAFSAGWSPCVGPVLGSIIMLAATRDSFIQAIALGVAYSVGLGIPFLMAALGITWVTTILRRYSKVMRYTEMIMGILLVVVGVMLIFGVFNLIATLIPGWTPDL